MFVKKLRSIIVSQFFIMIFSVIMITMSSQLTPNAFAQLGTNGSQTWLDKENNVKIALNIIPSQPTVGTPSLLKFTVQNLETDKPVSNLLANVVIFGSQLPVFRLSNISASDGQFTINVIFPNVGSYQIITRMTSQNHNVSLLASFTVIVSALQSALNPFSRNYVIWISILLATACGVASYLVLRKYYV